MDESAGLGVGLVVGRFDAEVLLALGGTLVDLLADLGNLIVVVVVVIVVVVAIVLLILILRGVAAETFVSDDGFGGVRQRRVVHGLEEGVVALDGTGGVGEDAEVDGGATLGAVGTDVGSRVAIVVSVVVVLVERFAFGEAAIVEFFGLVVVVVVIVVISIVAFTISSIRKTVHEAVLLVVVVVVVLVVVVVAIAIVLVVVVSVLALVLANLVLILALLLVHLLLRVHVRLEEFAHFDEVFSSVLAGTAARVLGAQLELHEPLDAGTGAALSAASLATNGGDLVAGIELQGVIDHPRGVLLAVLVLEGTGVGAGQEAMGVDRIGVDGLAGTELLLLGGGRGSGAEKSESNGRDLHCVFTA